jgi:hypothetical protein
MSIDVIMVKDKETKNKVRFAEQSDDPKIGTVYVPKEHADGLGDKVKITVKKA